jgi:MerR family transcriptional regulator, heat shock protein HspR
VLDPRERGVYVMSVAAELVGMHPQTLRQWERKGLLEPSRTAGGSRRYSEADVERLRRVTDLTEAGVNLEGAKRIIELELELARVRAQLAVLQADVDGSPEAGPAD